MALIAMSNEVVAPFSILLGSIAQLWEMRSQHGVAGALSLLSLNLQALVFAALAVRWFQRTGQSPWHPEPGAPVYLVYWLDRHIYYQWAFTFVNYGLQALGRGMLLVCYVSGAWRGSGKGSAM